MRWMSDRATEEWIFEAAVSLEDQGLLGEFCQEIGLGRAEAAATLVEGAWPGIRQHYRCGARRFDVERACRDMLGFSFVASRGG